MSKESQQESEKLLRLRDTLCADLGQGHLFPGSSATDSINALSPSELARLQELAAFELSYPGGVVAYLKNAKTLLSGAKAAESLEFTAVQQPPIVIRPPSLLAPSPELYALERSGAAAMQDAVVVLVAGGLGERLGFSGIKTSLPVDTASGVTFLAHFINNFVTVPLATASAIKRRIPRMVIMTSDDTHARTLVHLEEVLAHNNYHSISVGVDIVLLKQETVPCLADNDGRIAVDQISGHILRKPHGHGDVHVLLQNAIVNAPPTTTTTTTPHAIPRRLINIWKDAGVRYVCFCQDTNATSTWTLPVSLALSDVHKLDMGFTCVPRIPKEAVGLLCHVQPAAPLGEPPQPFRTVNVEYNKFDPIFRALYGSGDVSSTDPSIAPYSPFPGSINTLIVRFEPYAAILGATGGAVPEFINPKYKDPTLRTDFKAPTRVESLMQDVALLFDPLHHRVGGIVFERQLYHPVKNNVQEALAKFAIGGDAHCAASGEENAYVLMRQRLRSLGAQVANVADCCLSQGGSASRVSGANVVAAVGDAGTALCSVTTELVSSPSATASPPPQQVTNPFVVGVAAIGQAVRELSVQLFPMITIVGSGVHRHCTLSSLAELFPYPDRVRISGRSSLVIHEEDAAAHEGTDDLVTVVSSRLVIESLELDGALTIKASSSGGDVCRLSSVSVRNHGWSVVPIVTDGAHRDDGVQEIDAMRGYRIVPIETHHVTISPLASSTCQHFAKM